MAATGPARNDRRQTDYGSWRIDQGTSGNDGGFFQYTGTPCSGGSCPGWVEIDDNTTTRGTFAAGATALDQMHNDGSVWQFIGPACCGTCSGWLEIDDNPTTRGTFAGGATALDQMHNDGSVWQFIGPACSGTCPGWLEIDDNSLTGWIVAGSARYPQPTDRSIGQYTGTPCNGTSCPGWVRLDDNTSTWNIVAGPANFYPNE